MAYNLSTRKGDSCRLLLNVISIHSCRRSCRQRTQKTTHHATRRYL